MYAIFVIDKSYLLEKKNKQMFAHLYWITRSYYFEEYMHGSVS